MGRIKFTYPKIILGALSGQAGDFYLAGGTALAMYYFQHRESEDVDLFTQNYAVKEIDRIVEYLRKILGVRIDLQAEQLDTKFSRMRVYFAVMKDGGICKLDFVEDFMPLKGKLLSINQLKVLSLEDIYIRKICAACGYVERANEVGEVEFVGGRQEAKDFYDLYCLSSAYLSLAPFIKKFGNLRMGEAVLRWHRRYNRLDMKTGLLDLTVVKKIDSRKIEKHFDVEIKEISRMLING